ncbi:MAG: hypothetical protein ACN4GR_00585 [Arenicellales bacterium]
MPKYIFDSTGGCPRCDNMDGEYDEMPERPHDYCDCEIYADQQFGDCYRVDVSPHGQTIVTTEGEDPAVLDITVEFAYIIECEGINTSFSDVIEYQIDIEMPLSDFTDPFGLMDEVSNMFVDDARAYAISEAETLCECDKFEDDSDALVS